MTSQALVATYQAMIEGVNSTNETHVEIRLYDIEEAKVIDKESQQNETGNNCHGVRILVKHNISRHGLQNTAGTCFVAGARTNNESSVIARLKAARASILGQIMLS